MGVEPQQTAAGHGALRCILCGVDGSPAGEEAVRQAVRLRARDGRLLLVSVANLAAAAHPDAAAALEQHAAAALREAEREASADCESHRLVGDPVACLLAAARDHGATLIAVGSQGTSRLGGILAGSVATAMLHRAPCSVLIARPPRGSRRFPARIAVGIDGSAASRAALSLARELAARLDAAVIAVAASGAATDFEGPADTVAALRVDERDPVAALLDAASTCDLLILGARGLRGLRALGSVSERVAHQAPASVLVVRPPPHRRPRRLKAEPPPSRGIPQPRGAASLPPNACQPRLRACSSPATGLRPSACAIDETARLFPGAHTLIVTAWLSIEEASRAPRRR